MGLEQYENELPDGPDAPARELRRSYHDRIADVRDLSLVILRSAIDATAAAHRALAEGSGGPDRDPLLQGAEMQHLAASVDGEVVSLLALESPVARDLRMILAARDVTQLSLLCVGLCGALTGRVERVAASLTPELRALASQVGAGVESLMREAEAAWTVLDAARAEGVARAAPALRTMQERFISGLITMSGVPMDCALDLAMVARAFERLGDHAVEVAERVLFAVNGTTPPLLQG